jgi:acetyl esterase/lipase
MTMTNDPSRLTVRELEVHGEQDPLPARLYTGGDPGTKRDGLLVFFHGGGFVEGSLDDSDLFLRRVAERAPGYVVLASSYTRATVRPFPAAAEDAHAVLMWAKKNKARLGWTGKRMVASGIEAGANLAAVCSLIARDRGAPQLAGQILIMPMLDPGLSSGSMRELPRECNRGVADSCAASYRGYLPNPADRAHPYASPLQSSRLKNLPPALVLSVENDPLCDEAEQYGAKLISCGVAATIRRLAPVLLLDPSARQECACKAAALDSVCDFLSALEKSSSPS